MEFRRIGTKEEEDAGTLKDAVMNDLKDAKKYGKVSVGKRYLFFRGLFQGEYSALDDVVWIYLRQEDTQTSVCCGKATFETYFFMVVFRNGTVKKQRLERKEEVMGAIEAVRAVNPAIDVGYTAELREKYCF